MRTPMKRQSNRLIFITNLLAIGSICAVSYPAVAAEHVRPHIVGDDQDNIRLTAIGHAAKCQHAEHNRQNNSQIAN